MSDEDALDLDGGESPGTDAPKKASGLTKLLPSLLKFVAIGIGAVIFIVTVSFITYTILQKDGRSQTIIPVNSLWEGPRPQYAMFTTIGSISTRTKDPTPYAVVVDMIVGYDENDNTTATELTARLYEIRDFIRLFFRSKAADELRPENEPRLKQEIVELLNTRVLNSARARVVLFNRLDVMEM